MYIYSKVSSKIYFLFLLIIMWNTNSINIWFNSIYKLHFEWLQFCFLFLIMMPLRLPLQKSSITILESVDFSCVMVNCACLLSSSTMSSTMRTYACYASLCPCAGPELVCSRVCFSSSALNLEDAREEGSCLLPAFSLLPHWLPQLGLITRRQQSKTEE